MNLSHAFAAMLVLMSMQSAPAEDRLPTIPPARYDPDQKKAAAEFEAARHTAVFGPFEPMMHSPRLMSRARALGDYLRYQSTMGALGELVILMTAREWSQDYEWATHYPIALKAGIRKELADAVANDRRPATMSDDETAVYEYVSELLKTKQVSNATFARAKSRFGAAGVVDMTGIIGYYSLLAMQLNAAQYPPLPGAPTLPRLFR